MKDNPFYVGIDKHLKSWMVSPLGEQYEQKESNFIIFVITMESTNIKQELRALIEKENDFQILEAIKTLLVKSGLDSTLKEKLTVRALKAEEDVKAGRVFTREEFEEKLDRRMDL